MCENEYGHAAGSFFEESGVADYEEFMRLVENDWLHFAPCTDAIPYNAVTKEWLVYIPITIKADSPEQAIERAVADYGGPFALPIDRVELVDDSVEDI